MLKYKIGVSKESEIWRQDSPVSSPSRSQSILSRSDSLTSISSLESTNCDWGPLKIDVSAVNEHFHYKSIRVSQSQDVSTIIPILLSKLKLSIDCEYDLWMEVKTRREASIVLSSLRLHSCSKPLQLEKCLPEGMSRFILLPKLSEQ